MATWGTTSRKERLFFMRLLGVQLATAVLVASALWLLVGRVAGWSAMCGALIYLLPTLYQACQVLTPHNANNNVRAILRRLYRSEIWKMVLTMVLFAMVFALVRPIEPFSLFGAFVLMQLIAWLAPVSKHFKT